MMLTSFIADVKRILTPVLDRTGCIFYSAARTLTRGDIYILGLNPGGDSGPTITQDLDNLSSKKDNAYLDEKWENRAGSYDPGQAPLQRRLAWLAGALGYRLEDLCASNLIFMKSRDATGIDYPRDADICWPVHELVIDIVRPRLILTFGNSAVSPYSYLHQRFGGDEEAIPSGHGSWRCAGFESKVAGHKTFVAGLPHLSRYSPIDRLSVVKWLRERERR